MLIDPRLTPQREITFMNVKSCLLTKLQGHKDALGLSQIFERLKF